MSTHMAAVAALVDPVAVAALVEVVDRAEVADQAAAADTEVPEVQWAAVGTEVRWAAVRLHLGVCPVTVQPAVGQGTVVQDTDQAMRPPQPALMEPLCLIMLPRRSQKIRRHVPRLSGTVLLPTQS
ncbi:MAG TPA: hypothetical protein VE641_10180 [Chthoniobacterales bacterium]|nr:hypothetical protein [Chthoniobacterales bacterium]